MIYIGIIRNADALVNGKYSCICDLKKRRRGYRTSSPVRVFQMTRKSQGTMRSGALGSLKKSSSRSDISVPISRSTGQPE